MHSLSLPDLLTMDHKRIRALYRELKAEVEKDRDGGYNEEKCLSQFRTLKALITSHAKAEEYTTYSLFEFDIQTEHEVLQSLALEGYEEHDLVDRILKEMGQAEEISAQWRAQLNVVGQLLDHHIQQEEDNFLPRVKLAMPRDELFDLGAVYIRERDEIFTKKIRPASLRREPTLASLTV